MNKLCEFFNSLLKNKENNNIQRDNKVIIEFNYYKSLNEILSHHNIKSLVDSYPKSINIYMQNGAQEIDLVDYVANEEEYKNELYIDNLEDFKFKIIIDLKVAISNVIYIDEKINCILYYSEEECLKEINVSNLDYKIIEKKIINSEKNIIILFNSNQFFYNDNILVTNVMRKDIKKDINNFLSNKNCNYNKVIELRNIYCNWVNGTNKLTPNNLYIDMDKKGFEIKDEFKKCLYRINCNLVLLFISNFSGLDNGCYKSIINGSKRVEIIYEEIDNWYSIDAYKNMNKIYNSIYDNLVLDKLSICRNIIASLISGKCQGSKLKTVLDNSDLLLESFIDNYEAYCSGNVSKYFKDKDELKKDITNEIKSINIQIDNLIKLLITNMTSLIGISIAGVVGYLAKGNFFVVKLLGILYVIQLDINIILNLPIIFIRFSQAKSIFRDKVNEYVKLYFEDDNLKSYKKKKENDSRLLKYYIIAIIVIVITIHVFIYNILTNKHFIKYILNLINR